MKHILIAACLALGLAGCNELDFRKGDMVAATVGAVQGDPCLISIHIRSNPQVRASALVARLDTPECRAK